MLLIPSCSKNKMTRIDIPNALACSYYKHPWLYRRHINFFSKLLFALTLENSKLFKTLSMGLAQQIAMTAMYKQVITVLFMRPLSVYFSADPDRNNVKPLDLPNIFTLLT